MAFKAVDQSNPFNYGRSHYNMPFYCQSPNIWFTQISVSLPFASKFSVNNSSRRLSRCPRMISLDDRDQCKVSSALGWMTAACYVTDCSIATPRFGDLLHEDSRKLWGKSQLLCTDSGLSWNDSGCHWVKRRLFSK